MKRKRFGQLLTNEAGMESIQAVLILAVAALIMAGMQQLWSPGGGGSGIKERATEVVIAAINGETVEGAGGSTSGPGPGSEPAPPQPESPEEPPLESRSFEEVYITVAGEKAKRFAAEAVDAARRAVADTVEDGDWFDAIVGSPDIKNEIDFMIQDNFVRLAGGVFDGIQATGGLVEAEREIKKLANAGRYHEAWDKTWSAPARFAVETVLASKPVSAVLDRLPTGVSVAIQVGVPNAVEGAAATVAHSLWEPVGSRINNQLWEWYDAGYLPRAPRIPRDYF